MTDSTKVPRPFSLHWGSGQVTEEARFTAPHHEPCMQLLEFTEGEAAGTMSIRFCYYDHAGRFQRSPLMLNDSDIAAMRQELAKTPRLLELLRRLVE
jgi:hypothetical protein